MATIINNVVFGDQVPLRIDNPYLIVIDPTTGEPISGAKLYFGIVGRDPRLPENQKIVYALQESGASTPQAQPVITTAGGVPQYGGSPVALAVDGAFSYLVTDANDAQVYYQPKVDAINTQGFSGIIIEESTELFAGQPITPFTKIEATTASFYVSQDGAGTEFNGRYMRLGVDYEVIDTANINILSPYPDGTIIVGRQNDPTGQIFPVTANSGALFAFDVIATAKTADLQVGDTVTINGGLVAGDGLGGAKYLTVAGGTGTADDENFININNGNQLQLLVSNHRLGKYAEVTNTAVSAGGVLNLDLDISNVHEVTLTENITELNFVNGNFAAGLSTTVTLKVTQDSTTDFNITFAPATLWQGGVAPTVTATLDAVDIFVFTTYDGVSWYGTIAGQDFS